MFMVRASGRRVVLGALVLLIMACAGCSQIPRERFTRQQYTPQIDAAELAEHVRFLADPALEGRKTSSAGARRARQYIAAGFQACGLSPWHGLGGYEQSFGLGTNVIGVLRGTDPKLADELVIVMAHYDHLGVRNGRLYPGAADNASGVAAMLEIAEWLSHEKQRPRRSVCFASFDAEEKNYLGAFAFTGRGDFDPARVVAVINLNMLGRAAFDVMPNTLLAIGTGGYPDIRERIRRAAGEAQLQLLPVGTDLAGPASDHFAFEQFEASKKSPVARQRDWSLNRDTSRWDPLALPVVFLTSGLYGDYHQPTDTPDRLDYATLARQARAAGQVVREIAGAAARPVFVAPAQGDRQELQAIVTGLEQVAAGWERLALAPPERAALERMATRGRALLAAASYGPHDRRRFLWDLIQTGTPIVVRHVQTAATGKAARLTPAQAAGLLQFHEFLATHRAMAAQVTQKVVLHYVENRLNLLRLLLPATYGGSEIQASEIAFVRRADGQYRLGFVYPAFSITTSFRGRDMRLAYKGFDFTGTREDAIDFGLLLWLGGRVPDAVIHDVLLAVAGQDRGARPGAWLAWRLEQTNLPDERAWAARLVHRNDPELFKEAIGRLTAANRGQLPEGLVRRVLEDDESRPEVRAAAIQILSAGAGKDLLLAVAAVVNDPAPVPAQPNAFAFDPSYPLYEHPFPRYLRATQRRPRPGQANATLGAVAQAKLRELTGQNFGPDSQAWRAWIDRHM